jgi:hypothetical protein
MSLSKDKYSQVSNIPVHKGNIVVVVGTVKSELGHGGRGNTGASGRCTLKTAVAAAVEAGVGTRVGVEVAVTTTL